MPARHPLVWGTQPSFEATRTGHSYSLEGRYLRPYKRNLPDIFVSKDQLVAALDLANDLYRFLEARGHRVVFAPSDGHRYMRPRLTYDGKKRDQHWDREPWTPQRPTLAFFGSVAIGLTVYESSENVEVRWVDGKPVRLSEAPPPAPRSRLPVYDSTGKCDLPSRQLSVRAYSPYQGTTWEKDWHAARPERRVSFASIYQALREAAAPIAEMVAAAERRRREEQERHEADVRRWRLGEAQRKMAEAVRASRAELVSIIETWSFALQVAQFFEEVATQTTTILPGDERETLAGRAAMAREFLGGTNALQRLQAWKAPLERLQPEEVKLLKGMGGSPDSALMGYHVVREKQP